MRLSAEQFKKSVMHFFRVNWMQWATYPNEWAALLQRTITHEKMCIWTASLHICKPSLRVSAVIFCGSLRLDYFAVHVTGKVSEGKV